MYEIVQLKNFRVYFYGIMLVANNHKFIYSIRSEIIDLDYLCLCTNIFFHTSLKKFRNLEILITV